MIFYIFKNHIFLRRALLLISSALFIGKSIDFRLFKMRIELLILEDIMTRIKFMENVGKVATVTAVAMYVSYFPQIMNNLAHPGTGDWIQPLVAAINCTLWVAYGLFKEHRDIPVALANAPGIFFGLAAAITALM